METHLEKRRTRRYKAKLVLVARFAGLPETLSGETRDISSHGAFFLIPRTEQIKLGHKVSLEILVPEDYAISGDSPASRPANRPANRMFRIRASGLVVRLLHDGEMDRSRVAVAFSRHRLVRDEDAEGASELITDYAAATSTPEPAADYSLDAVFSPATDKWNKH